VKGNSKSSSERPTFSFGGEIETDFICSGGDAGFLGSVEDPQWHPEEGKRVVKKG